MTSSDCKILAAALLFFILAIGPAIAQTPDTAIPIDRITAVEESEAEELPVEMPFQIEMVNGKMTLNLPSVTFNTFLKIISMHSDMKLMTSPEIASKNLSVYLPDVTPMEALEAICVAYDLFLYKHPQTNVYFIRDTDTEFIKLEHIDVADIQGLIPTLVPNGKVTVDSNNNIIAVQGNRAGIDRVKMLVQQMDVAPGQVLIQATLAEISDDAERKLGIRWEPSGFFRGASRLTKFPFRRKLVDITESADAWSYGLISFTDFYVQLQAMEREGEARILANPRIAAVDRKEAEIRIASNIVIATSLTRSGTGLDIVTEEPIFADVGVMLKTTPRIHSDNSVTMVVEPSVSTASRSRFFEEAVDTFNRSARTTVMVENGETIAIGGLIRNDSSETTRRIPYLGKVPIIGRVLFTHKERLGDQTDLVVFITPTILTSRTIREDVELNSERFNQ